MSIITALHCAAKARRSGSMFWFFRWFFTQLAGWRNSILDQCKVVGCWNLDQSSPWLRKWDCQSFSSLLPKVFKKSRMEVSQVFLWIAFFLLFFVVSLKKHQFSLQKEIFNEHAWWLSFLRVTLFPIGKISATMCCSRSTYITLTLYSRTSQSSCYHLSPQGTPS